MMINMSRRDEFAVLTTRTNSAALLWKESRGISPDSVADKMDVAMLQW